MKPMMENVAYLPGQTSVVELGRSSVPLPPRGGGGGAPVSVLRWREERDSEPNRWWS